MRVLLLALALSCYAGCQDHAPGDDDDTAGSAGDDDTTLPDLDGDGYPGGPDGDDCDDDDPRIHPGADELCDGLDNDCDEEIDEDFGPPVRWWEDLDGDGYGNPLTPFETPCPVGTGYALNGLDCDDSDPAIHPEAEDVPCDGIDSDCDGTGDLATAYTDGVEYDTIQLAVEACPDGDTVYVCPGTHVQRVVVDEGRDLELISWSGTAEDTVLDGEDKWTILHVEYGARLRVEQLTFTRGRAEMWPGAGPYGGAVASEADLLELDGCVFTTNTSHYAGGALNLYSRHNLYPTPEVHLHDCLFEDNVAEQEGGAIVLSTYVDTTVTITDTVFRSNEAGYDGAAIAAGVFREDSTLSISFVDSLLESHLWSSSPGVVDTNGSGTVAVSSTGTTFDANQAGAFRLQAEFNQLTFEDCVFTGNSAWDTGVIWVQSGVEQADISLLRTTIDANSGPAIASRSSGNVSITVTDSTITRNPGTFAGGVVLWPPNTLTSVTSDWGEGATDNTPADVGTEYEAYASYGAAASFSCVGGVGCQ
jgi:hypothetical protein